MRTFSWAASVSLLFCVAACAASFDCTKARSAQERAICGSPDLSRADEQMALNYKAWLGAAPKEWAEEIRENQLVWLRERDIECPADEEAADLATCLAGVYVARTGTLRRMVQQVGGMQFVSEAVTLTTADEPANSELRSMEARPGFGTLTVTWAQASSSAAEWAAWTRAVTPAAIRAANEDEATKTTDWQGVVLPTVDRSLAVTVDRVNGQWVSATIMDFYDGHGAHPVEYTWQFYWLLGEQRELGTGDVFKPGSGWEAWMEQRLDGHLHRALDGTSSENYQSWFDDAGAQRTLEAIVTNPHDWELEPKGLALFFQPYQVACYACTPEPLRIPWADLKPYLQPGFALPQ